MRIFIGKLSFFNHMQSQRIRYGVIKGYSKISYKKALKHPEVNEKDSILLKKKIEQYKSGGAFYHISMKVVLY